MARTLRIGMVGLDTSHCVAFTRLLNDSGDPHHFPGGKVVAAYPGGSDLFSLSRDRVGGFTQQLRDEFRVRIVDSIAALAADVDAFLLESVDGRQHLEQFAQLAVGKPVYIDKPLATSTADAREIIKLARETDTPLMSCSSLRYAAGVAELVAAGERVLSCEAFGPAAILPDYPGLFWYGIHSAEMLFAQMGAGCEEVRCIERDDTDVVIGTWEDGRTGVLRGTRLGKDAFGCIAHTDAGVRSALAGSDPPYYALLMARVMHFFTTGTSPIDLAETFDIIAFLEATDLSRAQGGMPAQTATL